MSASEREAAAAWGCCRLRGERALLGKRGEAGGERGEEGGPGPCCSEGLFRGLNVPPGTLCHAWWALLWPSAEEGSATRLASAWFGDRHLEAWLGVLGVWSPVDPASSACSCFCSCCCSWRFLRCICCTKVPCSALVGMEIRVGWNWFLLGFFGPNPVPQRSAEGTFIPSICIRSCLCARPCSCCEEGGTSGSASSSGWTGAGSMARFWKWLCTTRCPKILCRSSAVAAGVLGDEGQSGEPVSGCGVPSSSSTALLLPVDSCCIRWWGSLTAASSSAAASCLPSAAASEPSTCWG
mmetsp:Transcript_15959/g.43476  ORF Transcript_15959/g.43476 Transcript_15959/m.43476 type:complete len:295 (+) Transcript_15959:1547-2431(+)